MGARAARGSHLLVVLAMLLCVGGFSPVSGQGIDEECVHAMQLIETMEGAKTGRPCCGVESEFFCNTNIRRITLDGVWGAPHADLSSLAVLTNLFIRVPEGKTLHLDNVLWPESVEYKELVVEFDGDIRGFNMTDGIADDLTVSRWTLSHTLDLARQLAVSDVTLSHALNVGEVFDLSAAEGVEYFRVHSTPAFKEVIVPGDMESLTIRDCPDYVGSNSFAHTGLRSLRVEGAPRMTALPELPTGISNIVLSDVSLTSVRLADSLEQFSCVRCGLTHVENEVLPSEMRSFTVTSNKLTLVPQIHNNIELSTFKVSDNQLTELPWFPEGNQLWNVEASHNQLRGLPAHLETVMMLDVSHNNISKPIDTGSMMMLNTLDVSHNRLTELALPPRLLALNADYNEISRISFPDLLQTITLSHNKIRTLPSVAGLAALEDLDVSFNEIETVEGPMLPPSLERADFSHNRITALPPLSPMVNAGKPVNKMIVLDASHNVLKGLGTVGDSKLSMPSLQEINVAHNNMSDWDAFAGLLRGSAALKRVNGAHNQFTTSRTSGALFQHEMPQLRQVSLQENRFSKPVLTLPRGSGSGTLFLDHSGFSAAAPCAQPGATEACLGGLAVVSYQMGKSGRTVCAVLGHASWTVHMDSRAYYADTLCSCLFGFVRIGGECVEAPQHGIAPGGDMQDRVLAQRGYWGHAKCTSSANLRVGESPFERCARSHTAVCSPHTVPEAFSSGNVDVSPDDFPRCAEGYTGRKCTGCAAGLFRTSTVCRTCPPLGARVVHVLVYVLVWVGMAALVFRMAAPAFAVMTTVLWGVQFFVLLADVEMRTHGVLRGFADAIDPLFFRVPYLTCFGEDAAIDMRLFHSLALLGVVGGVVLAVYVVGKALPTLAQWGTAASGVDRWSTCCVRALVMLLRVVYVPVCVSVFSVLPCERDWCTGDMFFEREPHTTCDGERATAARAVAGLLLAGYVVALPLLHVFSSRVPAALGHAVRSLEGAFREGLGQRWDGLRMGMVGVIAMFLSLSVDADSVADPLIAAILFFGAAMVQKWVSPFARARFNHIEYGVLLLESAAYTAVIAFFVEEGAGGVVVAVAVVLGMSVVTVGGAGTVAVEMRKERGL